MKRIAWFAVAMFASAPGCDLDIEVSDSSAGDEDGGTSGSPSDSKGEEGEVGEAGGEVGGSFTTADPTDASAGMTTGFDPTFGSYTSVSPSTIGSAESGTSGPDGSGGFVDTEGDVTTVAPGTTSYGHTSDPGCETADPSDPTDDPFPGCGEVGGGGSGEDGDQFCEFSFSCPEQVEIFCVGEQCDCFVEGEFTATCETDLCTQDFDQLVETVSECCGVMVQI